MQAPISLRLTVPETIETTGVSPINYRGKTCSSMPAGPPARLPDASPPAGLCMAFQFYSEKKHFLSFLPELFFFLFNLRS